MTLHHVIWRAQDACEFVIEGEGSQPITVKATPVVTSYWFGTTVGVLARTHSSFGYWSSSNVCGPVTAWRVAQILPRVKTIRTHGGGYDETLCGLVIALGGDRHEDRMRERAKDIDLTVDELIELFDETNKLWPTTTELLAIWDGMSDNQQDGFASHLHRAISAGDVEYDIQLMSRLDQSEFRTRTKAEQKAREDSLIAGDLKPEASLRQLLLDIGVTNLVYTVGYGEMWDPTHFKFDELDREIMRELIGTSGFCSRISLSTTARQPDDSSAHHVAGGGGVTMHWSDFGESGHPRLQLHDETWELVCVHWDRVTERFVLTLRPHGMEKDDSRDQMMSIEDLRTVIGKETGLDSPLIAGERARWLGKPGFFAELRRRLTQP